MSLQEYLSNLNSTESQWGIWINPIDVDDYKIAQFGFKSQILDSYVCIGNLNSLSFGFQSQHDAIKQLLEENDLVYNGKKIKFNAKEMLQAWSDGNLNQDFSRFLEEKAEIILKTWASYEAEDFIDNQIPLIVEQALEEN